MLVPLDKGSMSLVPDAPGCYWLVAVDEAGHPRPVGRAAGTDGKGVLYIGESGVLRRRFSDMVDHFHKRTEDVDRVSKNGHPAAAEWQYSPANQRVHPLRLMAFTWEELPRGADTIRQELCYLTNYRDFWGEYPPWNQPPTKYRRYLPSDNPRGRGVFRYDPLCADWLPSTYR